MMLAVLCLVLVVLLARTAVSLGCCGCREKAGFGPGESGS